MSCDRRPRVSSSALLFLPAAVLVCLMPPDRRADSAPPAPLARQAPGPLLVKLKSSADGKPVPGVVVRVGARYVGTGTDGAAVIDGLPAGKYPLHVRHPGFEQHDAALDLPPGRRDAVEVALVPVAPASVTGQVLIKDLNQPLAGARIALVPAAVKAAIRGRYDFVSHWDGKFEVLDIPPGRYRAVVSAPGCKAEDGEIEIKAGKGELVFRLEREWSPADLTVAVRDSLTGRPISNAKVVLAEAWPKGLIAEAVSDAAGNARFKDLKVGRLNRADAKDVLAISRRQVCARVEAVGYESTVEPMSLDVGAAAAIPLNPLTKIVEKEPNDTPATAQPIVTGAPVELKIGKVGDRDCFKFRVRHPAMLAFDLTAKGVLAITMKLTAATGGKPVSEQWFHKDQAKEFRLGVPAGEYVLEIGQWGDNEASQTPMTLTIGRTAAADALEPNDTPASARLLRTGEEARGCILPIGDIDNYRFAMERPGMVRFTMPAHPLARELHIRDEAGKDLAGSWHHPTTAAEFVVSLAAGRYVLDLRQWGNNTESTEPYLLRMETMPDDGIDDPVEQPGRVSAVRLHPPDGLVGGTLDPVGDVDRFAVALPSSGLLRVSLTAPIGTYMRVRSGDGRVLGESWAHARTWGVINFSAPEPMGAYVEVRSWGVGDWSGSPYVLKTSWEPCDEREAAGRDDTFDTAAPAEIGDVLRGNLNPVGDVDHHRLDIDHAGYLVLDGRAPIGSVTRIFDARGKQLAEAYVHADQPIRLGAEVFPGPCYVQIRSWGAGDCHAGDYAIATKLERAEPMERTPLKDDPIRLLKLGEAQPYAIDHADDRDRFVSSVNQAGKFGVRIRTAVATVARLFDDRTGDKTAEWYLHAGTYNKFDLEAKGPTRYRLELVAWGVVRSSDPGYVLVDQGGRDLRLVGVSAKADPFDPTRVVFARSDIEGFGKVRAVRVVPEPGAAPFDLPTEGKAWRYGDEGVRPATVEIEGDNGTTTISRLWVEAIGARERRGIRLLIDHPADGQVIDRDEPCRVRAASYTGAPVVRVELAIDDRPAGVVHSAPFALDVPWRSLAAGRHTLAFTAVDARGTAATVKRTVSVSEYFDLLPEDGAVLSGNEVRVTWSAPGFGPAKARFRARGEAEWKTVEGENARNRAVTLIDLEPGRTYEYQPLGAADPGPVRSVTRVKGLAFGRPRYGAVIARDYDQRLGVSVRNHADKPMTVRLECGKAASPELLVGFVGDGSEGRPFALKPGEEREFLLGLSAQDVRTPTHKFPIRIASENGFSDQAEVEVNVRLPVVKLEWKELDPLPTGLARVFRVTNVGDPLTDLDITADSPEVIVSPQVRHAMLPAGASTVVTVKPRLREGFKGLEAVLIAHAVGTDVRQPVKWALPEGKQIFAVALQPGVTAGGGPWAENADINLARAAAAEALNPAAVDWSAGTPEDSTGSGKLDRRVIRDERRDIVWVGEDTDGDGAIDFVHADIGGQGLFQYSAFKRGDAWVRTNLLEAWLEMEFRLPWGDRSLYEPHDADIVMNGTVVGQLEKTLPEGNYRFRIPPTVLRFGPDGAPAGNEVELKSRFLRGGHYLITSNFRIKLRLNGAKVWGVAADRGEAQTLALKADGLTLDATDYSVSSAEVRLEGPPTLQKGDAVVVTAPLRQLGAVRTPTVAVALLLAAQGRPDVELARQTIDGPPLNGSAPIRLPWKAAPGTHRLKIVVDPDKEWNDADRVNNEAYITVTVPGEAAPPKLTVAEPADGATLKETVFAVKAEATSDSGIARAELRIDSGLWMPLSGAGPFVGKGLLQPGRHTLAVRAVDFGGNQVEKAVSVTVAAEPPTLEIKEPAEGAALDARTSKVRLTCGNTAVLGAVRVNGGPWLRAALKDGAAEAEVRLPFGPVLLEAMAADARGAVRIATRRLTCPRQPDRADEPAGAEPAQSGAVSIEDLGPVDLFGPQNVLVPPAPAQAPAPAMPKPAAIRNGRGAGGLPALLLSAAVFDGPGKIVGIEIYSNDKNGDQKGQVPISRDAMPPGSVENDQSKIRDVLASLRDGDVLVIGAHADPNVFGDGNGTVKWEDFWSHFGIKNPPRLSRVLLVACMHDKQEGDITEQRLDEIRKALNAEAVVSSKTYFTMIHNGISMTVLRKFKEGASVEELIKFLDGKTLRISPTKVSKSVPGGGLQGTTGNAGSYCPNRPEVKVSVNLPEAVQAGAPPARDSGALPQSETLEAMTQRWDQSGVSGDAVRKAGAELKRWVNTLKSPDQLPSELWPPGPGPAAGDAESLQRWRAAAEQKFNAWWLGTLALDRRRVTSEVRALLQNQSLDAGARDSLAALQAELEK